MIFGAGFWPAPFFFDSDRKKCRILQFFLLETGKTVVFAIKKCRILHFCRLKTRTGIDAEAIK